MATVSPDLPRLSQGRWRSLVGVGAPATGHLPPATWSRHRHRPRPGLGLRPDQYAGHSLRAVFATRTAAADVSLERITRETRHASVAVAMRYIRPGQIWHDNSAPPYADRRYQARCAFRHCAVTNAPSYFVSESIACAPVK